MKTKLSPRFWLSLTLFSFIGQVAWVVENMYFNVFIYKMFNASASQISAMVSASAVIATLTTIFMGALSDRLGKRKLLICGGYLLWGISILSFALLRSDVLGAVIPLTASGFVSLVIIFDCIMTFFGSTANDAAFNAWLTDSTDETNRGKAEGINSMMPLVAIIAVFGGFMSLDQSKADSWTIIFCVIGFITLFIGVLGFFIIDNVKSVKSETGLFYNIFYSFRMSTIKNNAILYRVLVTFMIFNISIQIFMPYLILYYEVSLGLSDYVFIMAPAIILASVFTALWGRMYDKKGYFISGLISLALLCLGYITLFMFKHTVLVFIGSLLMMCGYLSSMAVFGAKIREHTPDNKAGMFQGIRIFSQVFVPGIVGPFIAKTILANAKVIENSDGTTSFVPNANIFLAALVVGIIVFSLFLILKTKKSPVIKYLETDFEKNIDIQKPWQEYPRPMLVRESYYNLNGTWNLKVDYKNNCLYNGEITVPFAPESRISGVGRTFPKKSILVYKKTFELPDGFVNKRLILNFGAVDQNATVMINGKTVGRHCGGYLPFSFDITDYYHSGLNELEVRVKDDLDKDFPYGKQRVDRGGMWYTPVSGIWQTVWLESVCENYITNIKHSVTLDTVRIKVSGGALTKKIILCNKEYIFDGNEIDIKIDNPINWTPDNPHLYEYELICGEDRIKSYFALRTVSIIKNTKHPVISINEKPVFFNGILDQGYYSDGIYTPASPEAYEFDIVQMKNMGFNMLRKHIKIEPQIFYFLCDKLGIYVFQDFVNNGGYNFIIDTALPTAFLKKGVTHFPSRKRREIFEKSCEQTMEFLYNHPSVCYYTIFNEGWGQYSADKLYKKFKGFDNSRIFDTTSGWFVTKLSDVSSEHIYFKPVKMKKSSRPKVLSEFGGYSCKIPDNSFNETYTYGYRYYEKTEEFTDGLKRLYADEVLPEISNGLCACVLTQLSDVEDETNGIITYDRKVIKPDAEQIKNVFDEIYSEFIRVNN